MSINLTESYGTELSTTTISLAAQHTTTLWENEEAKNIRRKVYYSLQGIVGLLTVLCNGFLLYAYRQRPKIQKHTSFIMLNVIISCFIHGWISGIIYPLQRVYRFRMSVGMCVITTLIMDWADKYILLLLPFLAIERLVYLKFPFMKKARTKQSAMIVSVFLVIFSALYSWLPLVPALNVPENNRRTSPVESEQERITEFYKAYTCGGAINKKNRLEPFFILVVSTLCVLVVIVVYIWMFMIAKARFAAFPHMTQNRKKKMKKAALSVMLVSFTFICLVMPYGIIYPLMNSCDTDVSVKENIFCNEITLDLRFIFSIVAHMANILAPLLFAFLNPHTRAAMQHYLACNRSFKTICRSMNNREEQQQEHLADAADDVRIRTPQPNSSVTSYHNAGRNGYTDNSRSYPLPSETPDTLISPVDCF